ncbi:predicted protein [Naegleria gruberi]|uniref:Predicted protein n=1 Tax=Naegleria gruberi TaxID=5762 RepID=D2VFW6_NAEGR|nr:uncharacterized protein NAEGRDRAFT_67769 [Naegleria gruberi]EFC44153.1 predicted protein [Naegleria gruberi]|eukprot:XP_002676897.1 predicted protein [Naegleria gruberi strain NEG-M]
MDEKTTLSLIDFKPHHPDLGKFLIKKLREPSKKIFSLKFENVDTLKLNGNTFYSQVNHQYKVLIVGQGESLVFLDLESRKELFKYTFDHSVYYFEIHGDDLFITFSSNHLVRFNFQKIYNRKPLSECKIWQSHPFKYIWGFSIWKNLIHVCDFDEQDIFILDYNTGANVERGNLPKTDKAANITFSSLNEMYICGLGFLEVYTLNDNNNWIIKKRYDQLTGRGSQGFYSLFYEEGSQRVFLTDSNRKVLIFDRDLTLQQTYESKNSGAYGIHIDSSTGYCYLCDNSAALLCIFK